MLGLQVRVLAPLARGYETRPAMSLGFDGRFERERYFIEVGAGFIVPSTLIGSSSNSTVSVGGIFLNGGVSFYLTDGDIAPYAGLGIEPRIVFSSSPIALAPYVQVGVMLWRQTAAKPCTPPSWGWAWASAGDGAREGLRPPGWGPNSKLGMKEPPAGASRSGAGTS